MSVTNIWSGALTHNSVWVRGKVVGSSVRLAVSTNPNLSSPTWFGPVSPTAQNIASIEATGLTPNTRYYYAFEVDSTLYSAMSGQFKTFGTPGNPYSFRFAAWSCAGSSPEYPGSTIRVSNSPVHSLVHDAHAPQFVLMTGDLHYRDINQNNNSLFRQAYDDVLAESHQSYLWRNVPIAYVWDDHDYGPNNSDKNSPGRPAAQTVYRERVPHYNLPATGAPTAGIWQTFVCGRVRFILTDIRSERDSQNATDNASKLMLGEEQEQWLFDLFENSTEPLICWVNTVPWISEPIVGSDYWAGYTFERQKIADVIDSVPGLGDRMFMVSGDMHGLAIDSGVNNQWGGFPVYQFAAMDAGGSTKGGPYSYGTSSGRRRYGIVDIEDDGSLITVVGQGRIEGNLWAQHTFGVGSGPEGLARVTFGSESVVVKDAEGIIVADIWSKV